jgi:hypothetical protein
MGRGSCACILFIHKACTVHVHKAGDDFTFVQVLFMYRFFHIRELSTNFGMTYPRNQVIKLSRS